MTTSDLKSPGAQSAGGANPRGDAGHASPAEIPPSATGSIPVPATGQSTGVVLPPEQVPGAFPKTCACCGAVYGRIEFQLLEPPRAGQGRAFTGFVQDGVRSTLEFRDCACGNTLSNLTQEAI